MPTDLGLWAPLADLRLGATAAHAGGGTLEVEFLTPTRLKHDFAAS